MEAEGTAGGIIVFWDTRKLELVEAEIGHFSVTCMFKNVEDGFLWAFIVAPQTRGSVDYPSTRGILVDVG